MPAGRRGTGAAPGGARRRVRAPGLHWLGMLPFLLFVAVFLGVPLYYVLRGAFSTDAGQFTLTNFKTVFTEHKYLSALAGSLLLSVWTSLGPALAGLWIAAAVVAGPANGLLRRVVSSAAGVLAYFAGAPLAFVWIATVGTLGVLTVLIKGVFGWDLSHTIHINSTLGVGLAYFYFQIPLMVIFITPALEGLKPEWEEAARNLGAPRLAYLRHVAIPVLAPSFLAATLMLFGSALSAYATAEALTNGTIPLTAIQIGSFLNGNVIAGQENTGKALGLGMVVIIAVAMLIYVAMQRRAAKWLR